MIIAGDLGSSAAAEDPSRIPAGRQPALPASAVRAVRAARARWRVSTRRRGRGAGRVRGSRTGRRRPGSRPAPAAALRPRHHPRIAPRPAHQRVGAQGTRRRPHGRHGRGPHRRRRPARRAPGPDPGAARSIMHGGIRGAVVGRRGARHGSGRKSARGASARIVDTKGSCRHVTVPPCPSVAEPAWSSGLPSRPGAPSGRGPARRFRHSRRRGTLAGADR